MALVSLERAHCSDPSSQNYLHRERCMALMSLEREHCSDPSFTKLLAQGALHGGCVPGESGMF